jgi:cytidyltransferase-like protein
MLKNILLPTKHIDNLSISKYGIVYDSFINNKFYLFWVWLQKFVPTYISPNCLTLFGLIAMIFALVASYTIENIFYSRLLVIFLTIVYFNLDAIDGIHARKTKSTSTFGEIFDHISDSIIVIFCVLIMANLTNNHIEPYILWFIIQVSTIHFQLAHFNAYNNKIVIFDKWTGPTEVVLAYIAVLASDITNLNLCTVFFTNYFAAISYIITFLYLMYNLIRAVFTYTKLNKSSIIILFVSHIIIFTYCTKENFLTNTKLINAVAFGFLQCVITFELILSKILDKTVNYCIVFLLGFVFYNPYLSLVLSVGYIVIAAYYILQYLNISMFKVNKNIYVNGVFDLYHIGHIDFLKNAKKYGTNLIVGVHSDSDVQSYKRKPVMSMSERVDVLKECKYVDSIIECAPLITNSEFINKYNIQNIVISDEYDKEDDIYYKEPREMGIVVPILRSDKMSTTIIIDRIAQNIV